MIKSVNIKNYILIDELHLDFDKGFNVITGETGAGKSIIISAIDVCLGAKTSKDVIKTGAQTAYIELVIELNSGFDKTILTQNFVDCENNELVISREILPNTTRSRINGVLVNHELVKDIRELLLDIHSQHQSYNYMKQKNHIFLLDNFALKPHRDNVALFSQKYDAYKNLIKKEEELQNKIDSIIQQEEFLKFQIEEIEKANIEDVDEYENLSKELDILSNIEKLKELSFSSYWALNGDDGNILNALGNVKSTLSKLSRMDESVIPIEEDFTNTYEALKEISSSLRSYSESKENDNERMDEISERMNLLDKIKRKYGNTLSDVKKTYEKLSAELSQIEFSQDDLNTTKKEIQALKLELDELSDIISKARKELAKVLSSAVTKELEKLELPKSRFEIDVKESQMNLNGKDRVEFLISTNVSELPKPLEKTASGGEISRIMLAIKTVFAQADSTNTVIFDEIDSGISGKASQSVADSISILSKSHQIILITHQPIIASKADKHIYVKKSQEDTTKVKVYSLEGENRVKAIALLSAGEINEESTNFAKNLLGV